MILTLREYVHMLVNRLHATLQCDADGDLVHFHENKELIMNSHDTVQAYECMVTPDVEAVEMLYALQTITSWYTYSHKHCKHELNTGWLRTIGQVAYAGILKVHAAVYDEFQRPNGGTARLLLNCGLLYHECRTLAARVPEIKDTLQMRELHHYAEQLEYAAGELQLSKIKSIYEHFAEALTALGSAFDPQSTHMSAYIAVMKPREKQIPRDVHSVILSAKSILESRFPHADLAQLRDCEQALARIGGDRRLAVMQATHQRLGRNSWLSRIDPGLVRHIAGRGIWHHI